MVKRFWIYLVVVMFFAGTGWGCFKKKNLTKQEIYDKVIYAIIDASYGETDKLVKALLNRGIIGKEIVVATAMFIEKMAAEKGDRLEIKIPEREKFSNIELLNPVLVHIKLIESMRLVKSAAENNMENLPPDITREMVEEIIKKYPETMEYYYQRFLPLDLNNLERVIYGDNIKSFEGIEKRKIKI